MFSAQVPDGAQQIEIRATPTAPDYWPLIGQFQVQARRPAPEPAAPTQPKTEPTKPAGFTLLGQHYLGASSWRAVLLGACSGLAAHHGSAFTGVACMVKGRTRHYIATSPDGMIAPAQIPGTELWVEANQSAKSVVQVIGKLLVALGHTPEEFKIDVVG